MNDDNRNDPVVDNGGENSESPTVRPGVKSMMRPGVVKVIGKVAPRQNINNFNRPMPRQQQSSRPNYNNRPNQYPQRGGQIPVNRQQQQQDFDGTVDDRMLPDAGLPTEFIEGFLDVTPDGHGYLRPKMIP